MLVLLALLIIMNKYSYYNKQTLFLLKAYSGMAFGLIAINFVFIVASIALLYAFFSAI